MPRGRRARPPRLWLRKRPGREAVWVILDRGREHWTGCTESHVEQAEAALGRYIENKYEAPSGPSRPDQMTVQRALEVYGNEHAPTLASPELVAYHIDALGPFWGDQAVSSIKGETCRAYVRQRKVKPATARRELETLSAALRYCHREGYLTHAPRLTYPKKAKSRTRWLTRAEAAKLLRAARRGRAAHYLPTFILIGLYTGTRAGAILSLQWLPNTQGGWVDLDAGLLHRGAEEAIETNKRQPTCALPAKLIRHLKAVRRRTRRHVIETDGKPIKKLRRSWGWAREKAGMGPEVTPHVLRHTCVTWLLQAGVPIWETAGYVGMSEKMVREHYGHHCPDFQDRAKSAI